MAARRAETAPTHCAPVPYSAAHRMAARPATAFRQQAVPPTAVRRQAAVRRLVDFLLPPAAGEEEASPAEEAAAADADDGCTRGEAFTGGSRAYTNGSRAYASSEDNEAWLETALNPETQKYIITVYYHRIIAQYEKDFHDMCGDGLPRHRTSRTGYI